MLKQHLTHMLERTQPRRYYLQTAISRRLVGLQRYMRAGFRRIVLAYARMRQPTTLPALYDAAGQLHYRRWQHWQAFLDAKALQVEQQRKVIDVGAHVYK
jgi:hypothetical protein